MGRVVEAEGGVDRRRDGEDGCKKGGNAEVGKGKIHKRERTHSFGCAFSL
jgi:hypothetical protein